MYFRLDLTVGIDGLSPHKSKKLEIWPIACRVINSNETNPFSVSLHAAETKPESVEAFLRPFLNEMLDLQANGLQYKGQTYRVNLQFIVCDAVARQFIKQIIAHNGYFACERWEQKGIHLLDFNCMIFPELEKIRLRTDQSFRRRTNRQHHQPVQCPLLELDLDMIKGFPLDYMHLVLLGMR